MSTQSFQAGAAKVDITPPLGTFINGDFVAHYARYIHDQLYAKALVMQQGRITIALVIVDICVMPKEFLDDIKTEISRGWDISFGNILISSTHTHAAGSAAPIYLSEADFQYIQKLRGLIIEAVHKAVRNLRPAKAAFGIADIPEHVLCRRYLMQGEYIPRNPVSGTADQVKTNPFGVEDKIIRSIGTTDPQASFLVLQGIDGRWISLLANYSLHYVGDWENGTISSDWFGEFSRSIQDKLGAGDDFIGIMSNGTSADVNIWDFMHPGRYPSGHFQKSRLIGNDISEKIFQSLQDPEWDADPQLGVQYEELTIAVRKPSAEELDKAKEIVSESDYRNIEINDDGLRRIYAREQILLNEHPDTLQFPVQAIQIGNTVIGGLGAEIFAETGLRLKEKCGLKNYFTIGLANGNAGYVLPAHEMDRGGYETWRSRTSKLEAGAEEMIRNKLLQLINKFNIHPSKFNIDK